MNTQQLRNSILQQAIQGKLVPQDPNDEPASVLLDRIRRQKEQLVKEGKLKPKDLVTTPIAEEEMPFELPNGWEWCRLGDLTSNISDGTHQTPKYVEKGVPFLSVQNISSGKLDLSKIKYITPEEHKILIQRVKPTVNDVLICRIGTLGKALKITWDFDFSIFVSLGLLRFVDVSIIDYIVFLINSPIGWAWIQENKVGGGTHTFKINLGDIPNMLLPLPPLAEQRRIVAKLEELLPLVEQYGKAQDDLDALNNDLPRRLRQSILQEAIQGKLVPQDPNEGTAGDLITSYGVLPSEPDEDAFCIPTSWSYIRFGDIVELISGTSYGKGDVQKQGLRVLRGGNIQDDKLVLCDDDVFLPFSYRSEKKNVQKGDIIIVASTGSKKVIGKPALIEQDYPDMQIGAFLRIIRLKYSELLPYIWLIFRSPLYRDRISTLAKGTNINNIKEEYITDMLIPLPPLAEQHRIVSKLEELLAQIDKLN